MLNDDRELCKLQVDVKVQPNGLFDVYICNEGNSGYHYSDMIANKIGMLVADEIDARYDTLVLNDEI